MWCKLDDIAYVGTGATPLTACKYYYENGNIAWINSSSTKVPFIAKASNFITQKAIEETNCLVYPKGTLVIAMYGEGKTRGQISELLIDAATNQACAAVRPYSEATKKYLKLFFEGNYLHIRALAEGGNQQNLSVGKIQNYEIPLPPLDEQKRILDKAKELLLQIDNIEVGKSVCQKYINQAKSKVLDLAIHGKLVSQDPNDEPAIELLKRINPKAEITCDTPQYGKLPKGWCSCTLRNVCSLTNGFAFSSDAYKNNGIPLVRISNITNEGKIDLNSCVYIQDEIDEQYIIEKGDFLVAMSGATTGKMGVYTYGEISYLNQRVGKIKASKALYTPYMHYLMYSQVDNILKMAYGGAQPNISAKAILAIRILLPPLAEQQRIVAKIEDLFTQLDKIEASL